MTCFDINIKYMHAGMNHCLAAAAESRWQKSAMMQIWEEFEASTLKDRRGDWVAQNWRQLLLFLWIYWKEIWKTLLDPGWTLLFTTAISKSNLLA